MSTHATCDLTGTGGSGALALPNIRTWGVEAVQAPDEDASTWALRVDFFASGQRLMRSAIVVVANASSTRLTRNASPTSIDDIIVSDLLITPTAFTDAMTAYRGGATKNARQKALADALIAANLMVNLTGPTT